MAELALIVMFGCIPIALIAARVVQGRRRARRGDVRCMTNDEMRSIDANIDRWSRNK